MGIVLVLYIIKENFCTRRGEKSRSIAIIWGLGLMLFKEDRNYHITTGMNSSIQHLLLALKIEFRIVIIIIRLENSLKR